MKKFLTIFFGLLLTTSIYAAQIANVEYIHNAIQNKHFITVPYNELLTDTTVAANMEYAALVVPPIGQVNWPAADLADAAVALDERIERYRLVCQLADRRALALFCI